jgi:hypothetical protein
MLHDARRSFTFQGLRDEQPYNTEYSNHAPRPTAHHRPAVTPDLRGSRRGAGCRVQGTNGGDHHQLTTAKGEHDSCSSDTVTGGWALVAVSHDAVHQLPVDQIQRRISEEHRDHRFSGAAPRRNQVPTSRPRPRSDGMAPDGAALETGARHSPGVSSQVGTQSSPARALCAFTQVDGTGRSGPAAACPMGRPMVSAGDEVSASLVAGCATASDIGLCRRAGGPPATEGVTVERGTRARHRQHFVDRTTPSA